MRSIILPLAARFGIVAGQAASVWRGRLPDLTRAFRGIRSRGLLSALVCLVPFPAARAWDKGGHMIVAQVAYGRLHATARAAVDALAGQIKDANSNSYNFVNLAAWMDDLKSEPIPHHGDFKPWHYVDLGCEAGDPDLLANPPKLTPHSGDVVTALTRARKAAAGQAEPLIDNQAMGLAMLLHLVGDIHQPLHAGSRYHHPLGNPPVHEQGGLEVPIANFPAGKLHFFWDSAYRCRYSAGKILSDPEVGHDTAPNEKEVKAWAKTIKRALAASSANLTVDFSAWAKESEAIACGTAYAGLPAPPVTNKISLTRKYTNAGRRVARERMALAGYRLAALLNDIYGP